MARINPIDKLNKLMDKPKFMKQGEIASMLGVTQANLSRVMTGKQTISSNMAARLHKAGIGSVEDILYYDYMRRCEEAKSFLMLSVEKDCLK